MYYKGAWLDMATPNLTRPGSLADSKLGKSLHGRFPPRTNAPAGSTDAWIGHGCAHWAVESCLAYTDTVFRTLDIPAIYEHVRDTLQAVSH
jgi:hypothetical protein